MMNNNGTKILIKLPTSMQQHIAKDTNQMEKKKKDLSEYRDLFSCLFKIKDKDVQQRVLNAINNTNPANVNSQQSKVVNCSVCKLRSVGSRTAVTATTTTSTQTCPKDFVRLLSADGCGNINLSSEKDLDQTNKFNFRMRKQSAPYAKNIDPKTVENTLAETRKRAEFKEVC